MSDTTLPAEYLDRFAGVGRLYGLKGLERLRTRHACVLGVGGVGSWTVEALARSGVGRISLVDLDDICVTNTNRQLHTHSETIGVFKVDAMAERLRLINPELQVHCYREFFTERSADHLLSPAQHGLPEYDVVIDAIDHTERKALLIAECWRRGLPVVVSGAAGGRRDPTKVTSSDLSETTHDGLLRNIRRALRSVHGLPNVGAWGIQAVYSVERPVYPSADGEVCETAPRGEALRLNCQLGFGAATHLTATFGFVAAHHALHLLTAPSATQGDTP